MGYRPWSFVDTICILRRVETDSFFVAQFVEFYYKQFDDDRKQLAPLYVRTLLWEFIQTLIICQHETSMLTFESSSIAGAVGIVEKLVVNIPKVNYDALLMQLLLYSHSHSKRSNMPCRLLILNLRENMVVF